MQLFKPVFLTGFSFKRVAARGTHTISRHPKPHTKQKPYGSWHEGNTSGGTSNRLEHWISKLFERLIKRSVSRNTAYSYIDFETVHFSSYFHREHILIWLNQQFLKSDITSENYYYIEIESKYVSLIYFSYFYFAHINSFHVWIITVEKDFQSQNY